MHGSTKIILGSTMSLLMVASASAAAMTPAMALASPDTPSAEQESDACLTLAATNNKRQVEGSFTYDQSKASSSTSITSIFAKAASTLCASMPEYGMARTCAALQLHTPQVNLEATVSDLAAEDEGSSYTLKCSCASNLAGGGAIANADVSGVSIAGVAAMVGAI